MSRLLRLKRLQNHAWYGPILARRPIVVERASEFIRANDKLAPSDFIDEVNATVARAGNRDDALLAEVLTVINQEVSR